MKEYVTGYIPDRKRNISQEIVVTSEHDTEQQVVLRVVRATTKRKPSQIELLPHDHRDFEPVDA